MGGVEEAFRLKNEQRMLFKLDPIIENPSLIMSQMSPATPPPNPIGKVFNFCSNVFIFVFIIFFFLYLKDLVNDLQFANPNSSYKRKKVSIFVLRRNKKQKQNNPILLSS